jgi:serine protease inhibitor
MGLKSIFNSQEADFSKLIDNSNIKFCINEILQWNSININEIGTQIFDNKNINLFSSFFYEKEMVVDRPFIFIVKNKNFYKKRNIILIAKIEDL